MKIELVAFKNQRNQKWEAIVEEYFSCGIRLVFYHYTTKSIGMTHGEISVIAILLHASRINMTINNIYVALQLVSATSKLATASLDRNDKVRRGKAFLLLGCCATLSAPHPSCDGIAVVHSKHYILQYILNYPSKSHHSILVFCN